MGEVRRVPVPDRINGAQAHHIPWRDLVGTNSHRPSRKGSQAGHRCVERRPQSTSASNDRPGRTPLYQHPQGRTHTHPSAAGRDWPPRALPGPIRKRDGHSERVPDSSARSAAATESRKNLRDCRQSQNSDGMPSPLTGTFAASCWNTA